MMVSLAAIFSIVTRYVTILKTAARETKLPGVDCKNSGTSRLMELDLILNINYKLLIRNWCLQCEAIIRQLPKVTVTIKDIGKTEQLINKNSGMCMVSSHGNFYHCFFTEYEHLRREKEECSLQQLTDAMVIRAFLQVMMFTLNCFYSCNLILNVVPHKLY